MISREEGGDDVKSSWPLRAGLHTCYNGGDSGQRPREGELIPKSRLSSDCTLQLECMKLESLVIVDQHATVNTFPGLVHTARHTMGVGFTRSRRGTCGWITSFLRMIPQCFSRGTLGSLRTIGPMRACSIRSTMAGHAVFVSLSSADEVASRVLMSLWPIGDDRVLCLVSPSRRARSSGG